MILILVPRNFNDGARGACWPLTDITVFRHSQYVGIKNVNEWWRMCWVISILLSGSQKKKNHLVRRTRRLTGICNMRRFFWLLKLFGRLWREANHQPEARNLRAWCQIDSYKLRFAVIAVSQPFKGCITFVNVEKVCLTHFSWNRVFVK